MLSAFISRAQVTQRAVLELSLPFRCSAMIRTFAITATPWSSTPRPVPPHPSPSRPCCAWPAAHSRWSSDDRRIRRQGSANCDVSIGLDFAFMMSGSLMKRGSFRRRSVVITAGRSTSIVSRPASTSRVTLATLPFDLDFRRKRRLRAIPQRSQHLPGLVAIVVDGLLAEDDDLRLFFFDQLEQDARCGQRLDRLCCDDMDRAIRAHRQPIAQMRLRVGRARSWRRRPRSRRLSRAGAAPLRARCRRTDWPTASRPR